MGREKRSTRQTELSAEPRVRGESPGKAQLAQEGVLKSQMEVRTQMEAACPCPGYGPQQVQGLPTEVGKKEGKGV